MRVRVVGAGIVGLTSALRLVEAGHQVQVMAAELLEGTTSSVAAALWYPYGAAATSQVGTWLATSYVALDALAGVPDAGVRLRRGREFLREPAPDPWWRSAVPDLDRIPADRLPAGYRDGYQLTLPVVDMARHLEWLTARLNDAGVGIETRRLAGLAPAFAGVDAVVNCAGLGARELAGDPTLTAVRGQILLVEQFGLTEWLLDQSEPDRLTYLVPRGNAVVLGGTSEAGDEDLTVRGATTEAILVRCGALIPEAATARILACRVGLRPARPSVRLDIELSQDGPVVHCYGHGGAGVTLSYGCAAEVVERISELR